MRKTQQKRTGYFGEFGGCFAPETLMPALSELDSLFRRAVRDPAFTRLYRDLLHHYNGRPTPLYYARRLSARLGGARIYLKREDLNHTGAHKITNSLGQTLLAGYMGKKRVIAETGAGQHGVATATSAALLGLPCAVYMGTTDMARQQPNVFRMRLLGSEVIGVDSGTCTLKDAVNEAMRDWTRSVRTTHYVLGSALGPHPYPTMVRYFQSIIGRETRKQILEAEGRLPDEVVACVGGGSNAIGIFSAFLKDTSVKLTGVEAGGEGIQSGNHAARLVRSKNARPGILQGTRSYVLQTPDGQIAPTHSISAGLDYSGVGPEHAWLRDSGRASYTSATDAQALKGFQMLCEIEGIIPALESAHALAYVMRNAAHMPTDSIVVVNLSGRGDKDIFHVANALGVTL